MKTGVSGNRYCTQQGTHIYMLLLGLTLGWAMTNRLLDFLVYLPRIKIKCTNLSTSAW